MIRIAAILLSHLILWVVVGGFNHELSRWQLQLFAGGLFVCYPALRMGPLEGLLCSLLAGLLVDASAPLPFGQTALLFGIACVLMQRLRPRLPHGEPLMVGLAAAVASMVLYLARLALMARGMPTVSGIWGRIAWELSASAVFAALAAPWFIALQERMLLLARLPRERRLAGGDED